MIDAPSAPPAPAPRGLFHRLRVAGLEPVAEDAVAVTFEVPSELEGRFRFRAGQHLTLRMPGPGSEERRTYSICSAAPRGPLRVGVRLLPGGLVSTRINRELRVGDELEVMEPAGSFTFDATPGAGSRYAAVAAGSGITPVLSLVSTAFAEQPRSTFTLIYGNRSVGSTMFLDELGQLKDRYPSRLQLLLVFSRERHALELQNGRIDRPKLRLIAPLLPPPGAVQGWFLCGPHAMIGEVRGALAELAVDPGKIRTELFYVEDVPPTRTAAEIDELARPGEVTVTARLNGRESTFAAARSQVLVDALAAVRDDAPFSCKGGVCATCRARLLEGRVAMDHTYALDDSDRARGFILTCQSHPISDRIVVDYDG